MSLRKANLHLKKDIKLQRVIASTKILKLPNSGNVFNELVKAIVYQQISYKAADSIYNRFVGLMGTEKYKPGHLIKIKFDDLRSVGFSTQKANYAFNIGQFFKKKKLYNLDWSKLSDQEILDLLTQIKGVGSWTAEMILIFQLNRPDVFPVKDLAIQLVMQEIYNVQSEKTQLIKDLNTIAESWRPFRTYASLYLWAWRRDKLNEK